MKVGDRVKFVNDVGVGRVVKISGSTIEVDIEDGFIMPCNIAELVVVQEEDEIAAIKSIGVGDERPGKKGKSAPIKKEKAEVKAKKEPAYAKYGKISLISDYKDEDDTEDDDFDDSYLDLDRINEIYRRNQAAAQRRELEFEQARLRQERAKLLVTESSASKITDELEHSKEKMESVTLDELAAKISADAPKPITILPKKEKKAEDIEIIDLHAEQILESSKNMTSGEIIIAQLARFTISLDLAINSGKHGKIVFIHGVGSGRLKFEIQKLLKSKYPKIISQDASFKEYGYGATMIFV